MPRKAVEAMNEKPEGSSPYFDRARHARLRQVQPIDDASHESNPHHTLKRRHHNPAARRIVVAAFRVGLCWHRFRVIEGSKGEV